VRVPIWEPDPRNFWNAVTKWILTPIGNPQGDYLNVGLPRSTTLWVIQEWI